VLKGLKALILAAPWSNPDHKVQRLDTQRTREKS